MKLHYFTALFLAGLATPLQAQAQTVTPAINIGQEQMMMLQASQHVLKGDLGGAEVIYGQVLGVNPQHLQAHIQRAITRREMGNGKGMEADAVEVINIAQLGLQKNPNDPVLYYSRGMAYRILKDFPKARTDIQEAIRLSPDNSSWQADLMAIDLEEKMF